MLRILPDGASNVNLPSSSVIVQILVPGTVTVAPITGWPVSSSTVPPIVLFYWVCSMADCRWACSASICRGSTKDKTMAAKYFAALSI